MNSVQHYRLHQRWIHFLVTKKSVYCSIGVLCIASLIFRRTIDGGCGNVVMYCADNHDNGMHARVCDWVMCIMFDSLSDNNIWNVASYTACVMSVITVIKWDIEIIVNSRMFLQWALHHYISSSQCSKVSIPIFCCNTFACQIAISAFCICRLLFTMSGTSFVNLCWLLA